MTLVAGQLFYTVSILCTMYNTNASAVMTYLLVHYTRKTRFGVFARNRVPRCDHPGLYIINTDSLDGPGVHWLLVYATEDCTRYIFDSLAMDKEYANAVMNSVGGRCIVVTHRVLQNETSQMCGGICIAFCKNVGSAVGTTSVGHDVYTVFNLLS